MVPSSLAAALAVAVACSTFEAADSTNDGGPGDADAATDAATDVDDAADGEPPPCPLVPVDGDGSVATTDVRCGNDTVQLLTDPRHCGACFHDCRGASCNGGLCDVERIVAPDAGQYTEIAGFVGDQAFFGQGPPFWTVARVLEDGGGRETVVELDAGVPDPIGVSQTHVFVAQYYRQMVTVPLDGGGWFGIAGPGQAPNNIVAVADHAYWGSANTVVGAAAVPDAALETYVSNEPGAVHVAISGTTLYWASLVGDGGLGGLGAVDVGTRNIVGRSTWTGRARALAVDNGALYLFDEARSQLLRFNRHDLAATPERVATWTDPDGYTGCSSLVVDGAWVYARIGAPTSADSRIVRFSKCGGEPPAVLARAATFRIVVGKSHVLWGNYDTGLLRVAK